MAIDPLRLALYASTVAAVAHAQLAPPRPHVCSFPGWPAESHLALDLGPGKSWVQATNVVIWLQKSRIRALGDRLRCVTAYGIRSRFRSRLSAWHPESLRSVGGSHVAM